MWASYGRGASYRVTGGNSVGVRDQPIPGGVWWGAAHPGAGHPGGGQDRGRGGSIAYGRGGPDRAAAALPPAAGPGRAVLKGGCKGEGGGGGAPPCVAAGGGRAVA